MLDFCFLGAPSDNGLEVKVDSGYYHIYTIFNKDNDIVFKYRGCIDGQEFHSKRVYKTIYRVLASANKHYKQRRENERSSND